MRTNVWAVIIAGSLSSASFAGGEAPASAAGGYSLPITPAELSYSQPDAAQTEPPASTSPKVLDVSAASVVPFGQAKSRWWGIGAGVAYDFEDATDLNLFGTYSYFLAENVEFLGELGGWYYTDDQEAGVNLSMVFRWHFYNDGKWTTFVDGGIGLLGTTDDVPERGTSFNFTPRVGVGFTRLLSDDGLRLLVGVRWAHISNARINGDGENPSRDSADLYVGLIFPF